MLPDASAEFPRLGILALPAVVSSYVSVFSTTSCTAVAKTALMDSS